MRAEPLCGLLQAWSQGPDLEVVREGLAFPLVASGRVPWIDNTALARAQVKLYASGSRRALLR